MKKVKIVEQEIRLSSILALEMEVNGLGELVVEYNKNINKLKDLIEK